MKTMLTVFLLILSCLLVGFHSETKAQSRIWVNGYYASWMQGYHDEQGRYTSDKVDFSAMTHVAHFYWGVNGDRSSGSWLNNWREGEGMDSTVSVRTVARAHSAGTKILATAAGGMNTPASDANRAVFIGDMMRLLRQRGYDGIDIDWEPISTTDTTNYRKLINQLYDSLSTISPRPLLTVAHPPGEPIAVTSVWQKIDQINVMTYDLPNGAWQGWVTWPDCSIYSRDSLGNPYVLPSTGQPCPGAIDVVMDLFHSKGIPYSKLGFGSDWYLYDWVGGVMQDGNGVLRPRETWVTGPSVYGGHEGAEYYNFMDGTTISSIPLGAKTPGIRRVWDVGLQVPYWTLDNTGTTNDHMVTLDDQQAVRAKIDYAKSKGLGGMIVWEIGAGYRPGLPAGTRDSMLQNLKYASIPLSKPNPPVLSSPSNGATGVPTNTYLVWNSSTNAFTYHLQVSTDSTFAATVVNASSLTSTQFQVSLNGATLYYWHVSAANDSGESNYSTRWHFTTGTRDTVAPTVSITSPPNGAKLSGSITVTATASDNVGVAGVQFKVDGSNLNSEVTSSPWSTTWNTISYSNGIHTLTAVARDAAGNTKTSSAVVDTVLNNMSDTWIYQDDFVGNWFLSGNGATITTQSTEHVYDGTYALKMVVGQWIMPMFRTANWSLSPTFLNPADYSALEIYIYVTGNTSNLYFEFQNDSTSMEWYGSGNPYIVTPGQWTKFQLPMSEISTGGHTFDVINIMEGNTGVTWYIDDMRLVGAGGDVSPPSAPTLLSPANGATGVSTSPTLSWNASTGAISYQLQASTSSGFTTTIVNQSGITATSYAVSGLASNTTYYWRVNATNVGGTSGYSSVWSFTTLAGTTISHSIVLPAGWSMISSYVQPSHSALDTLLGPIIPYMQLMKNGLGPVYWPLYGIYTLGPWDYHLGYQIYMYSADTLTITGVNVSPETTPISLSAGANLVAYLRNSPMQVDSALASVLSNLIIAKNNAGQVYYPTYGMNTIGSLKPGQGYQVLVTQATTLTYPANTSPSPPSLLTKLQTIAHGMDLPLPQHYRPSVSNTGANVILLVEASQLNENDEIAVWTPKKILVGSGVINQGKALITIWGDDISTQDVIDGAAEGEPLSLTFWSVAEQREGSLTVLSLLDALTATKSASSLRYKTDAVWVAQALPLKEIPKAFSLSQNYPNPFNPSTVIRYGLPYDAMVTLEVFNILGQRIALIVNEEQKAGNHEVVFQNPTLGSGVYFYRLTAGNFAETRKMVIVR